MQGGKPDLKQVPSLKFYSPHTNDALHYADGDTDDTPDVALELSAVVDVIKPTKPDKALSKTAL
ncbi:unnamed protein product [Sphenostylis stenocarpa]|uniref:Uncharacterized protein n=1 Tax=Sphenostylis stenocarpa TaxID=92480 RepID=A0AA86W518_9FABA|nr:unnamed protein product [Sphenostylis stenocarpa]